MTRIRTTSERSDRPAPRLEGVGVRDWRLREIKIEGGTVAKGKSYNPLLKTYPDSEKINAVSEGAEVLYVRLLAASDDAGRYYGDAEWVLSKLFTHRQIKKQVTAKEIEKRIGELANVGLLRTYTANGNRYVELIDAVKSLRHDRPKSILFPEPSCESTTERKPNDTSCPSNGSQTSGAVSGSVTATDPGSVTDPVSGDPESPNLPDHFQTDQFRATWIRFVKLRRKKRASLDSEQAADQIKKLAMLTHDNAIACLELSITNGYQGLFPEKFSNAKRPGQGKINASAGQQYREGAPVSADHGTF